MHFKNCYKKVLKHDNIRYVIWVLLILNLFEVCKLNNAVLSADPSLCGDPSSHRSTLRLEMGRIVDENDWLRDELSDTQRRLMEAEAELAELREEKKQREFMDELKSLNESAANIRPITPSKIPVGRYRVEQEKDINRAMSGGTDSNRTSR